MKKLNIFIKVTKYVLLLISFFFIIFAPLFTWKINEHQTFICNGYIALFGGNFGFGDMKLSLTGLFAFIFLAISIIWNLYYNALQILKKEIQPKLFKRISYGVALLQVVAAVLLFYTLYNFSLTNEFGDTIPTYFETTYFYTLAGSFSLMSGLINTFELLLI